MSKPRLFFDASALFAGVVSSTGAARALMLLGEAKTVTIIVSEQVLVETERNLIQKVARALPYIGKPSMPFRCEFSQIRCQMR